MKGVTMRRRENCENVRTRMNLSVLLVSGMLLSTFNFTASALEVEEAAKAFGTMPNVRGMALSPDGQRVSFITHSPKHDLPVAMSLNLSTGEQGMVTTSEPNYADVRWCDWANDSRLLCGFFGTLTSLGNVYGATRLVAVNYDGSGVKVLAQRKQRHLLSLHQDEIVDWLPDDRNHILMEIKDGGGGEGVGRVNIYTDRIKTFEKPRPLTWNWMSDGRGNIRVMTEQRTSRKMEFKFRAAGENAWQRLHTRAFDDAKDEFSVAGFGEAPNELYVLDSHEGRIALFREDLGPGRGKELVYAHPDVDVDDVAVSLGKNPRIVGASYTTDRPHISYFDASAEKVHSDLNARFPGESVTLLHESWNREFYLVRVSSDVNSGAYYRYAPESGVLDKVTYAYPWLSEVPLAPMRFVEYPSDDGVVVSGYVTASKGSEGIRRPTIILPHGGHKSRDEWGYDFLAQFLAARGYVVLQSNYRGSAGFGADWKGDGVYRDWKQVVKDLEFGARYLIEKGVADPDRICSLGWNYGGYASLMGALEYPDRYRCVVSIAPVTDPIKLIRWSEGADRRYQRAQIGSDPAVIDEGSPVRRAKEMKPPVLLFHGKKDLAVEVKHSRRMEKALRRAKKEVEYVEYEEVGHSFSRNKERIDLLTRIGAFLEDHLNVRVEE